MKRLPLVLFYCVFFSSHPNGKGHAKGPHHPGGDYTYKSKKIDHHLQHENEDDLKQLPINEKELAEMSDEEKNFYYFKLHDSDNNDNLDGLEMLHAATHNGHLHNIDKTEEEEANEFEDEFTHIVGVIDDFIEFADLDKNGLLNYPEYIKAIHVDLIGENATPSV